MLRHVLGTTVLAILAPQPVVAQEPSKCTSTDTEICVEKEDLKKFLQLAKERQCLDDTTPKFTLDGITVVTDQDGRVFYSGADPEKPYKLHMSWCHYEVSGEGEVKLIAAMTEPPTWGFRFRPKAFVGYLPLRAFEDDAEASDGFDAGLMLDFFYYKWANLNVHAGFRSTGAGFGFDLTKNFGAYLAYAFGWKEPYHQALGSIYFAF